MFLKYFSLILISACFHIALVSANSYGKLSPSCPQGNQCRQALNCPGIALIGKNIGEANNELCIFNGGQIGVCCQEETIKESIKGSKVSPIKLPEEKTVLTLPRLGQEQLTDIIEEAATRDRQLQEKETQVFESSKTSPGKPDSPEKVYQRNLGYQPNISSISLGKEAHFIHQLGIALAKK